MKIILKWCSDMLMSLGHQSVLARFRHPSSQGALLQFLDECLKVQIKLLKSADIRVGSEKIFRKDPRLSYYPPSKQLLGSTNRFAGVFTKYLFEIRKLIRQPWQLYL